MPSTRLTLPAVALAATLLAPVAIASPPPPITPAQFPFPAAALGPADASTAGLGFADRWLGEAPFDNPAVALPRELRVTPQLARTSRQDVHAANRDVDDGGPTFDLAGARASLPIGSRSLFAYVCQPVLRVDNVSFILGRTTAAPGSPGQVVIDGFARELRAGVGVSTPGFGGRVGLAGEFTSRSDTYERTEVSGSPDAGLTRAEFSGTGFGATVGGRWQHTPDELWGWTAGAALRWSAALDVDGTAEADLISGASAQALSASRASGFEGGASARVTVGRGVRAVVGLGGGTARDWDGFALEPGAAAEWRLGFDLRDPQEPWIVRLGVGQEIQPGTPEPRAGHVAVGFGWDTRDFGWSVAVIRRSFERPGLPAAHDDRLVLSVGLGL